MKPVTAWMLSAALVIGLLAGCEGNKEEPIAAAPVQAPPPPPFPESQVPRAEPQPAPQSHALAPAEQPEPPEPPMPVDEEASTPRRRAAAAPRQAPRENYARAPQKASQTYVVRKGDTLQKISNRFYGTTKNWRKIYEANRRTVKDPDKLSEGTRLTIP